MADARIQTWELNGRKVSYVLSGPERYDGYLWTGGAIEVGERMAFRANYEPPIGSANSVEEAQQIAIDYLTGVGL